MFFPPIFFWVLIYSWEHRALSFPRHHSYHLHPPPPLVMNFLMLCAQSTTYHPSIVSWLKAILFTHADGRFLTVGLSRYKCRHWSWSPSTGHAHFTGHTPPTQPQTPTQSHWHTWHMLQFEYEFEYDFECESFLSNVCDLC